MGEVNMKNIEQEATRKAIEILSKLGHIPPDRVDILIVRDILIQFVEEVSHR